MALPLRPKAPARKKALLTWANKNGVPLPKGFRAATPYVGESARKLIRTLQERTGLKVTGLFDKATLDKLMPFKPRIVQHTWRPASHYSRRKGTPPYLVVHNAAAVTATPGAIHSWHLARGFTGFGYHLYVRKDGSVHEGRPLWAMGAHTMHFNDQVGICCEGNYDAERVMPAAQLRSLKAAIAYAKKKTGARVVRGHREMPNNATSCPGRNFPMEAVR